MIRSIVVEDDKKHSDRLKKLLGALNSNIEIVCVCTNVDDTVAKIEQHHPDLVFLDISLQGNESGGFDVLRRIKNADFDVLFTTAHVDSNINEIRRSGLGFVVKPYIESELAEALKKLDDGVDQDHMQIKTMRANLLSEDVQEKSIFINVIEEGASVYFPIKIKEIIYCFFKDPIVTFVINSQMPELLATKVRRHNVSTGKPEHERLLEWQRHMTMKQLEKDFSDLNFCRIHNSYLINMLHVKKFMGEQKDGSEVKMSSNEMLPVSANGKKEFMSRIGRL